MPQRGSRTTSEAQGYRGRNGDRSLTIRMPPSLFEFIKTEAIDNRRSLSNQVVSMLEDYKPPKGK